MNSFALLQAMVFEPRKAFVELGERPRVLLPMLLLIIATAGIVFWYYQVVDIEWFTDQQIRGSGFAKQMTEEQIDKRVRAAAEHPGTAGAIASVSVALGSLVGYLLFSAYYLLAGKVTNVQRSFKHWLALTCWTGLPSLLSLLCAAFVLLTATNTQISQEDLRLLSLNSLFFQKEPGDSGYALLSQVGLPELLALYLAAFGVRVWSGRSWIFSAIFTLLPTALILGAVALFTMGRS